MDETTLSALSFLVNQLAPQEQTELFSKMGASLTKEVKHAQLPHLDPYQSPLCEVDIIHHSWITPLLRKLTENDIRLILAALKPHTADAIKEALLLRTAAIAISPLAKDFFKDWVFQELVLNQTPPLPIACLPSSPLNELLSIGFQEIDLIIDLLAMHDLNTELKHIIETAKLKQIQTALTKEQISFLAKLQKKREKVVFKGMNLSNWNGDIQLLKTLLRQRGLNRFAKALTAEHKSLIWYVKRRINQEEVLVLEKLLHDLHNQDAISSLKEDLVELLSNVPKTFFEDIA